MTQLPDSSWVYRFSTNPKSKLRIICFHYTGGNAYIFSDWVKYFPDDIEIFAVQLPGRMNLLNSTLITEFDELIKPLCQQLLPYLQEKPFIFFGYSLGALISQSLSLYLLDHYHLSPEILMIAACASPSIRKSGESIHLLSDNELLKRVSAYLNNDKHDTHPLLTNPELQQLMLPILRADFSLSSTYHYKNNKPLNCPILAYGGSQDTQVTIDEIIAWKIETTNTFIHAIFEGDHFFIENQKDKFFKKLLNDMKISIRDFQI